MPTGRQGGCYRAFSRRPLVSSRLLVFSIKTRRVFYGAGTDRIAVPSFAIASPDRNVRRSSRTAKNAAHLRSCLGFEPSLVFSIKNPPDAEFYGARTDRPHSSCPSILQRLRLIAQPDALLKMLRIFLRSCFARRPFPKTRLMRSFYAFGGRTEL